MRQAESIDGIAAQFVSRRLGEVCDLLNGLAFKPEDWSATGLPIIRIQNLNGGQEFNFYQGAVPDDFVIKPGTLLFAWSGNRGTSFGPFVWQGPTGVLNQHIFKVTPKPGTDAKWLHHALHIARERAEREAHGGSGLVHVRREDLLSFAIPTPGPEDQRQIAIFLDTVDEAIARTEAVIAKLKQVRAGLLHDLLTRGLDEHGQLRDPIAHPKQFKNSPLGLVPNDWQVTELRQHYDIPSRNGLYKTASCYGSGHRMIHMPQMFKGVVVDVREAVRVSVTSYELQRFGLQEGDLVFARRSLNLEGAGLCSIIPPLDEPVTFESSIIRVRLGRHLASPRFVAEFLRSPRGYILRRAFIRQVAVSGVSSQDVGRFLFPCPKPEEQERILAYLEPQDYGLSVLKRQASKLLSLKQGLTSDLLTGRVRVPEGLT